MEIISWFYHGPHFGNFGSTCLISSGSTSRLKTKAWKGFGGLEVRMWPQLALQKNKCQQPIRLNMSECRVATDFFPSCRWRIGIPSASCQILFSLSQPKKYKILYTTYVISFVKLKSGYGSLNSLIVYKLLKKAYNIQYVFYLLSLFEVFNAEQCFNKNFPCTWDFV
jgi:hypothetical protein